MKLALIGTHGVGKTTLCYELAARLKRRNLDVEIVREVARSCPLPINEGTTARSQEWILLNQISLEIEASSSHELVVCDRSVLDNYCYMVYAAGAQPAWEHLIDYWIPTYDQLVYVPLWSRPSYDGVRAVDPGFQHQIDDLLGGMITARGLRPLRLDGDCPERWGDDIIEAILPRIEPTMPLFPTDEDSP